MKTSAAQVVGWVEARPDGGFGHGLSRAETHHSPGLAIEASEQQVARMELAESGVECPRFRKLHPGYLLAACSCII